MIAHGWASRLLMDWRSRLDGGEFMATRAGT